MDQESLEHRLGGGGNSTLYSLSVDRGLESKIRTSRTHITICNLNVDPGVGAIYGQVIAEGGGYSTLSLEQ